MSSRRRVPLLSKPAMKRSGRGPDCTKLVFVVLTGSLVTALCIFLTLQVFVVSSHQSIFTSQDGDGRLLLGGHEETVAKVRLEELSTALLKVTEQVEKLKGMLLTLQSETKVVTAQLGQHSNLEQVIDGVAKEIKALKSERPVNLYMGGSIVMCWIDYFHKYFFLDSRDRGVTPHLCQGTVWESKLTGAVAKLVKPGQNVVDVGASVGWYTSVFAHAVGPTGRVLAVEANPRLAELLTRTLVEHTQVQVVNKALGNADDKQVFIGNDMSWSPGNKVEDEEADGRVPVAYVKLDTLLQDEAWHKVDVVKVDVEGHEWRVWQGMQMMVADNPGLELFIEINARRDKGNGVDAKMFYEDLQRKFKKMFSVSGDDGSLTETDPAMLLDTTGNIFLYLKN